MSQHKVLFSSATANRLPVSLGRNGEIQTSGVLTEETVSDVRLQPLTKSGNIGRCHVSLPKDPKALRELAAAFMLIAEDLEPAEPRNVA